MKENGFLVSKETVVLRRFESDQNKNLVLSNELIKPNFCYVMKDFVQIHADKHSVFKKLLLLS